MNENETQTKAVELSLEQAKSSIEKMEAFLRLVDNKDFELLFTEGYFKAEASRVVLLKADPSMSDDQSQKMLDKSIDAIGYLRQYIQTIMHFGKMAEKAIQDDRDTLEELQREAAH